MFLAYLVPEKFDAQKTPIEEFSFAFEVSHCQGGADES